MTKQLWAPWRLEYITRADEETECIFCRAAAASDEEGLVVARGEHAFVLLNKFPYASGHLMVASYRHVGEFADLTDEEALQVHRLGERGPAALAVRCLRARPEARPDPPAVQPLFQAEAPPLVRPRRAHTQLRLRRPRAEQLL